MCHIEIPGLTVTEPSPNSGDQVATSPKSGKAGEPRISESIPVLSSWEFPTRRNDQTRCSLSAENNTSAMPWDSKVLAHLRAATEHQRSDSTGKVTSSIGPRVIMVDREKPRSDGFGFSCVDSKISGPFIGERSPKEVTEH